MLVNVADLLPPLKRFVVRSVQKYVKRMIPPATFAHLPLAQALAEGRSHISAGARPLEYADALTPESIAALQYTGGTTGVAKGAVLTHHNLLANVSQGFEAWKPRITPGEEVMLTALPLYHIFAFTANLMIFFAVGGRNILVPSPRPFTNLQRVMTQRADHLVHRRQHALHRAAQRAVVPGDQELEAERLDRRRHGARAVRRAAVAANDRHTSVSGLRADRNVARRHAQSISSSEARLDWSADCQGRTSGWWTTRAPTWRRVKRVSC